MNIQHLPPTLTSKYAPGTTHTIPARRGVAVPLSTNQTITVTNTHGTQVVDFWFVSPYATPISTLSMCHTRASTLHLTPCVNDTLVSNHRQPMLTFLEDTTPAGIHDTLIAACDIHRYHELGVPKDTWHASCTENYRVALRDDVGIVVGDDTVPPDPLNLFMNIPVVPGQASESDANEVRNVSRGARVVFERPLCREGDYVVLRAEVDGVVVMSACPQDILLINQGRPVDAAFRID